MRIVSFRGFLRGVWRERVRWEMRKRAREHQCRVAAVPDGVSSHFWHQIVGEAHCPSCAYCCEADDQLLREISQC